MSTNPLAKELQGLSRRIRKQTKELAELDRESDWFRNFNQATAVEEAGRLLAEEEALESELNHSRTQLADEQARTKELTNLTKAGWDPLYWFSSARLEAKNNHALHHLTLSRCRQELESVEELLLGVRTSRSRCADLLARYDRYDEKMSQQRRSSLQADLALLHTEHEQLAARKVELDSRLEGPLKVLDHLQNELEEMQQTRETLERSVSAWERDVRQANDFIDDLSRASNGYDRAMIHQKCEREFDEGSPNAVAADRRRRITKAKAELARLDRPLEAKRRDVEKARTRIQTVVDRGIRVIGSLVVDGSNLCYQGEDFIGLSALRPLTVTLAKAYNVTVIFDASIRHRLGKARDFDLDAELPGAEVHVVPSRTQADETILIMADDPLVYVISNDRFSEFGDKAAVRDHRVLRHQILNARVIIHDLDLVVAFN